MFRKYLPLVAIASVFTVFADRAAAQVAFGVVQQNGVITGGGLQIGGVVTSDRTGVGLGLSATANNWQTQNARMSRAFNATIAARRNRVPSVEQFVKSAAAFDRNGDERLDQEELREVAVAAITELQQLQHQNNQPSSVAYRRGGRLKSARPTTSQMAKQFVTRCMDFDADRDEALDAKETRRMAAALIRSLI